MKTTKNTHLTHFKLFHTIRVMLSVYFLVKLFGKLNDVILNVTFLNVVTSNVVMPSVILLSVITPNVIMLVSLC
jgi:hypothetical protein